MRNKRFLRWTPALVVALLVFSLLGSLNVSRVYASAPSFDNGAVQNNCSDGWTTCAITVVATTGEEMIAIVDTRACGCGIPPITVADTVGNTYTLAGTFGSGTAGWMNVFTAPVVGNSNNDVVTASSAASEQSQFTVVEYRGVTALGTTTSGTFAYTVTTTNTINLATSSSSSTILEQIQSFNGGGTGLCTTFTATNTQTARSSLSCATNNAFNDGLGVQTFDLAGLPPGSYPLGQSVSGISGTANGVHFALELQGTAPPVTTLATQCLGNCGNPAVTIANTNSTHSINFNQSITLFYQFQSGLNGFFLNVTTNVAKTYTNGQIISLGLYIVQSCPVGATPFTANCPGNLIVSNSFPNPQKGRLSMSVPQSATTILTGQWAAAAITCQFAPCDINDTNTNVPIQQASGSLPPIISQSATLGSCACKAGLWAFITGNIVTQVPPPAPPTGGSCAGFLDCVLPNLVRSFCSNPTPICTNESGLLWGGILAIFFTFFTLKGWGEMSFAGSVKLPIVDVFLFWGIIWMLVMGGLALTFTWVPLLILFVVSLMFGKHGTFL